MSIAEFIACGCNSRRAPVAAVLWGMNWSAWLAMAWWLWPLLLNCVWCVIFKSCKFLSALSRCYRYRWTDYLVAQLPFFAVQKKKRSFHSFVILFCASTRVSLTPFIRCSMLGDIQAFKVYSLATWRKNHTALPLKISFVDFSEACWAEQSALPKNPAHTHGGM